MEWAGHPTVSHADVLQTGGRRRPPRGASWSRHVLRRRGFAEVGATGPVGGQVVAGGADRARVGPDRAARMESALVVSRTAVGRTQPAGDFHATVSCSSTAGTSSHAPGRGCRHRWLIATATRWWSRILGAAQPRFRGRAPEPVLRADLAEQPDGGSLRISDSSSRGQLIAPHPRLRRYITCVSASACVKPSRE